MTRSHDRLAHDRLVVGFDGSRAAHAALAWAGDAAECRRAAVRVISSYWLPPVTDVYGIGMAGADPGEVDRFRAACELALRDAVTALTHRHPGIGVDFHAIATEPASRLVDESTQADLVVVGSNGMGAVKNFLFGSVVGTVLHESACPVVVVPESSHERRGTIVVGVDGSASADAAVRWAVDEADRRGNTLTIVHAWEYPYTTIESGSRGGTFAEVDASIVVERVVERATEQMAGEVHGQLIQDTAVQALLDASDRADMVVVGSRGRGGFRSMLLGSVAQGVAAHSKCPVVVVRRDHLRWPLPGSVEARSVRMGW